MTLVVEITKAEGGRIQKVVTGTDRIYIQANDQIHFRNLMFADAEFTVNAQDRVCIESSQGNLYLDGLMSLLESEQEVLIRFGSGTTQSEMASYAAVLQRIFRQEPAQPASRHAGLIGGIVVLARRYRRHWNHRTSHALIGYSSDFESGMQTAGTAIDGSLLWLRALRLTQPFLIV